MPRDWKQGLAFLLGFAFVMWLGPLVIQIASGDVGDGELRLVEQQMFERVNEIRAEYHRESLTRNTELDAVARAYSVDMATRGFFSHVDPDGKTPPDRIDAGGFEGYSLAAENLGKTTDGAPVREILNGWMFSKVHRKNLLAPPFNTTGIGAARAPDGSVLVVQLYATLPR
jgi:uncharacterized protein YkwD